MGCDVSHNVYYLDVQHSAGQEDLYGNPGKGELDCLKHSFFSDETHTVNDAQLHLASHICDGDGDITAQQHIRAIGDQHDRCDDQSNFSGFNSVVVLQELHGFSPPFVR
jgi:hypothetical protein